MDNVIKLPTKEKDTRTVYVAFISFQKVLPMEGHITLAADSKEEAEAAIIKAYGPHSKIAIIDIYKADEAPGIIEALQPNLTPPTGEIN